VVPTSGSTPIEDDEYEDEQPALANHPFDALNACSGHASHLSPLTSRQSLLTISVSELKSDDGRKCIATWGRREFRDLLTGFFHGIVHDRVARAIHDGEFRHGSIGLNLEAHIDDESCTSRDLAMRLVPGALKPILDDLSVETDVGFAVTGRRPMFLSLAIPGPLLMFVGLSGTASCPMLLLCVCTIFCFFGFFAFAFGFRGTTGFGRR
jgi:hypothetical protein